MFRATGVKNVTNIKIAYNIGAVYLIDKVTHFNRGDEELIERALFLKKKLDSLPENQGHLYDNTGKTVSEEVTELSKNMEDF